MGDDVNTRRPYDSSRRQEQARQTRQAIIAAAQRLFLDDGFAATTMTAIADAAGVSVQTVYKAFDNKPGLAKAVFDVAIAGDDEPVAVRDRPALTALQAEPDPHAKLRLYGEFLAEVAPRHVPLQLVIRDAAAADPAAQTLWEELQAERLHGMGMFAEHLADSLRPDVTVAEARDVLWTYNSAELFQLLVLERGWSPIRYGRWVARALAHALLPEPTA